MFKLEKEPKITLVMDILLSTILGLSLGTVIIYILERFRGHTMDWQDWLVVCLIWLLYGIPFYILGKIVFT